MKVILSKLVLITVLLTFITACKDKAKEATTSGAEKVETANVPDEQYLANVSASTIKWKGFKPTGTHFGTINLEDGIIQVANGEIVGGTFKIDMSSIQVLDIPAEDKGNAKLSGHLKSDDFFHVEKYPSAIFEITGLEEMNGETMLSGNLTLKDATNNVSFPVEINEVDGDLLLKSETFTIDRSKWNVKYGSKSFFDGLGDKFINDAIELQIMMKATKA